MLPQVIRKEESCDQLATMQSDPGRASSSKDCTIISTGMDTVLNALGHLICDSARVATSRESFSTLLV